MCENYTYPPQKWHCLVFQSPPDLPLTCQYFVQYWLSHPNTIIVMLMTIVKKYSDLEGDTLLALFPLSIPCKSCVSVQQTWSGKRGLTDLISKMLSESLHILCCTHVRYNLFRISCRLPYYRLHYGIWPFILMINIVDCYYSHWF